MSAPSPHTAVSASIGLLEYGHRVTGTNWAKVAGAGEAFFKAKLLEEKKGAHGGTQEAFSFELRTQVTSSHRPEPVTTIHTFRMGREVMPFNTYIDLSAQELSKDFVSLAEHRRLSLITSFDYTPFDYLYRSDARSYQWEPLYPGQSVVHPDHGQVLITIPQKGPARTNPKLLPNLYRQYFLETQRAPR